MQEAKTFSDRASLCIDFALIDLFRTTPPPYTESYVHETASIQAVHNGMNVVGQDYNSKHRTDQMHAFTVLSSK